MDMNPDNTRPCRAQSTCRQPRLPARGFSLIELMIVVAIIGILAGIAIPNYSEYVLRGKIVEATTQLAELRTRMEKFYQDERNYGTDGVCGNDGTVTRVAMPAAPTVKHFTYTCATTGQDFTLTATGIGSAGTGGFVYTLNEANQRRTTAVGAGWNGVGSNCWVTAKGGGC
jgi:type IV pilus assembly protein PilE